MNRVAIAALILCLLGAPRAGAQRPGATEVTARATAYVARLLKSFTSVVAEETYVQNVQSAANGQRVATKADFLLVQLGAQKQYAGFRDVFEVNGRKVRDHENRLVELFSRQTDDVVARAAEIHAESSRYNIGPPRTINSPLLGVAMLQEALLPHFSFSLDRAEKVGDELTDVLVLDESVRPTLLREDNGDAPAHGRFWIAQSDGAILRSEIQIDTLVQTSRIITTFQRDARFGVAVPVEMSENYKQQRSGGAATRQTDRGGPLTATATYGRFRQFEITTVEEPTR